jgi:hypothetical protein
MSTAATPQSDVPHTAPPQQPVSLTPADLAKFARLGISPELLAEAHVQRVTNDDARQTYGILGSATQDMSGIVFPYFDPATGRRVTARVRRDNPEAENGNPKKFKNKYISAYGDRKHLYFPPGSESKLQDVGTPIVLVEAEKSALALTAWAERTGRKLLAVGLGGCWGWKGRIGKTTTASGERVDEVGPLPDLAVAKGRTTYILLDANAGSNPKVQLAEAALAKALRRYTAQVQILRLPSGEGINGPDDFIGLRGDAAMETVFDGHVDGAELLDNITSFIQRYVSLPAAQASAVSLWVVHTHALTGQRYTPYLEITSAEKQSGKSRLLETIYYLIRKPWKCDGASVAALFRKVDQDRPTMLYDESDASFKGDPEYAQVLRGFFNSGNHHRGCIARCIGKGTESQVKDFSTFCPKAIAGIGRLPDTVSDRSIPVRMERKWVSEKLDELRERFVEPVAAPLRDRIAAWVSQQGALWEAIPEQPSRLSDRQRDAVDPLLAIADAAGGEWPQRARTSLVEILTSATTDNQSIGVQLLSDIKTVFEAEESDRLPSAELVDRLKQIETSPWADWNKGRGLTTNALASQLKKFRVYPTNIRVSGGVPKGYRRSDFEDAFGRYLARETPESLILPDSDRCTATDRINTGENPLFEPLHGARCSAPKNGVSANEDAPCGGVAVEKQGDEPLGVKTGESTPGSVPTDAPAVVAGSGESTQGQPKNAKSANTEVGILRPVRGEL